ncbi:N-methylhydantoinase A [Gammaproteobacteria bacterium]|nr:hydantoinase/oxoprolinase family protein [Gammaproteobacteria bacterium]CAG0945004.1 N-methylhydantoinase A [Gammaproteobacteria bacterium]
MSYHLGVDVGGTFTDLILVNEKTGDFHSAKVPSTPHDSSVGVLNGIERVCQIAGIDPNEITHVMHGTTVATNTILTHTGAKVGLVTTKGYRQVLQIARSFVPGGLGGWVIYNKPPPLAPLALTIEAVERIGARGEVVTRLDKTKLARDLKALGKKGIESLTVSLINSFANPVHEQEIAGVAAKVLPGIPVSLSSEVVPEMQEYERTVTTVANAYVGPKVSRYVRNLHRELKKKMKNVQLHVLRSDGGLASAKAAEAYPVNMLMSGPAGGVTGAIWVGTQAGFKDILTFDMGGTSTDVALIQDGKAQLRRETSVHEVTVRASSVDVRTVGAGGGSIAYVPEITGALRVGPQSAGAVPGPAAYDKGGVEPTVTDANVVLGYLPSGEVRLGGDMVIRRDLAEAAVSKVAKALKLSVKQAAAGIIDIVNENMYGALRLVSVEKGYDPRDFALMGFGGAGPLHANALGKLSSAWPVIIPQGPGVLCALGDATTSVRDEASRTFIRGFSQTSGKEISKIFRQLAANAAKALDQEGIPRAEQTQSYQVDIRYHGQGLLLTVDFDIAELEQRGLDVVGERFDEMHRHLFTFALPEEKEIVNLRAVAQGKATAVTALRLEKGGSDASAAVLGEHTMFVEGRDQKGKLYDRSRLKAGNVVKGPAVILQMDTTTLILPGHIGRVDDFSNILITPE